MKRSTKQVLWLVLFGVVLVAPILIMLIAPEPSGRQLWRDVAVGLGFLGFALMGFVFVPGGRLRMMTEVFELDTLYKVHHTLSRAAFFLVLAHPLLLIVQNPNNFVALNLLGAPWKLRAGVIAFALMVLLVMTSIWRQWLRLRYEVWRGLHNLFSIAVVGFALYHIFRVDYYTALPLQRALWVLYAVVWGGIITYIRIVKPAMLLRSPYELVDVVEERGKTWTLALEPVGHAGMPFKAGQVAWLSVGHSPFRIKEHPFSFSSSAEHPERVEFAIRELGDWTSTVGTLEKGTQVYIDGPYGLFEMADHPGTGYIFIAGGIGAAPVMSMLRTLAERGDDRPLHFFYGNPTWESIAFREELEMLQEKLNLKLIHVLERPHDGWEGETGYITKDVLHRHVPFDCTECFYFICGPLPMIRLVTRALHQLNIPQSRIDSERYEMA